MIVKTGYYSSVARKYTEDCTLIAISNTVPTWFAKDYVWIKELAPDWNDINAYKHGEILYEQFCERYYETLIRKFGSIENVREIVQRAYDPTKSCIVLLCYEKDRETCHRFYFAKTIFPDEYVGEI